jgi:hypothetical protein
MSKLFVSDRLVAHEMMSYLGNPVGFNLADVYFNS